MLQRWKLSPISKQLFADCLNRLTNIKKNPIDEMWSMAVYGVFAVFAKNH